MANVKSTLPVFQKLSEEWNKKTPNLEECGRLLATLKETAMAPLWCNGSMPCADVVHFDVVPTVPLTPPIVVRRGVKCLRCWLPNLLSKVKLTQGNLTFLPTEDSAVSDQELVLARDTLEIGAQWAIAMKDIESFERYMAQLKCYYLDYSSDLAESPFKFQLLGLNLLRLLAQNKLADFHTELELLPMSSIQSSVYIKHPVAIEQYLMEGSYNKVFLARGNVPAASYNFFMDILLDTIRNEIASCLEKAYDKIALTEAGRMLFFESEKLVKDYAKERNWILSEAGTFHFEREQKGDDAIPTAELATRAIEYARELEMII